MKLNRLETHDRLQHLIADQSANVFKGAEDCLKRNPLSLAIQEKSPYIYLFAHPRTTDDGVNKKMFWQPRLTIPEAQENSYLFRATSKTDQIEVIWMIPPKDQWNQYTKGNVTESHICFWSINTLKANKEHLEKPHPEDMIEDRARIILKAVIDEHRQKLKQAKLKTLGACPSSLILY